jgi:hypothetical protein
MASDSENGLSLYDEMNAKPSRKKRRLLPTTAKLTLTTTENGSEVRTDDSLGSSYEEGQEGSSSQIGPSGGLKGPTKGPWSRVTDSTQRDGSEQHGAFGQDGNMSQLGTSPNGNNNQSLRPRTTHHKEGCTSPLSITESTPVRQRDFSGTPSSSEVSMQTSNHELPELSTQLHGLQTAIEPSPQLSSPMAGDSRSRGSIHSNNKVGGAKDLEGGPRTPDEEAWEELNMNKEARTPTLHRVTDQTNLGQAPSPHSGPHQTSSSGGISNYQSPTRLSSLMFEEYQNDFEQWNRMWGG